MATLVEGKLSRVDVGDEFTAMLRGPGGSRAERTDFTVAESCGENAGQWYCVTHGEAFRNNWDKDSHIRAGAHTLAWVCIEHGPEVP